MPPSYMCEYLPRLQKVSVHIELGPNFHKIKSLALEGTTLSVTFGVSSDHNSDCTEQVSIQLPFTKLSKQPEIRNISPRDGALLIDIACHSEKPDTNESNFMSLSTTSNIWSVKDLLSKTPQDSAGVNQFSFLCARCNYEVLSSSAYKFVDLPSEFWHEMMDFWHCHKPHEDHHNQNQKNYDGKIVPRAGFVNVGSSYLQVADVESRCQNCQGVLGQSEDGVLQMYKWRLKLAYGHKIESYQPYLFVYFALLDRINSSGTRKFALTTAESTEKLVVWVTSVGLDVSLEGHVYFNCLKILYRQDDAEIEDVMDVPPEVWSEFSGHVTQMNAMVPESQKRVRMMEAEQYVEYNMAHLCPQSEDLDS